jgi:tetratricopeptide (TPR) repeat protein
MGQDQMALESFSAAIELDASDPRVYHNRASVYKRLKRFKEAALDAAAASFMDPGNRTTKRLAAWSAAEACAVKIQAIVRGRNGRKRAASRASSAASSRPGSASSRPGSATSRPGLSRSVAKQDEVVQ